MQDRIYESTGTVLFDSYFESKRTVPNDSRLRRKTMGNDDGSVVDMWKEYLKSIGQDPVGTSLTYESWHFCDNEEDANELAQLVLEGTKRATASLYQSYEFENEELPKEGNHIVVTDWDGIARCIIKSIKVTILPFGDVTEDQARIEGEGDKSLKYWREGHIGFFTRECQAMGLEFNEDMLVVFQEFKVVYP